MPLMGQWIVITMAIAFANTDLMVVNVISVKRDSQAANVTNANRKSLVTIVINANQAISITHCVKVCKSSNCFFLRKSILHIFLSQNVFVTLTVQLARNVEKTTVFALATRDLME